MLPVRALCPPLAVAPIWQYPVLVPRMLCDALSLSYSAATRSIQLCSTVVRDTGALELPSGGGSSFCVSVLSAHRTYILPSQL
ncbi:hypothetical protein B0H13DRAFT_2050384, partial [Mycena leptocephala]